MIKVFSRFFFSLAVNFFTWIFSIFFMTLSVGQWFLVQRFFTEAGTTDLHRFFSFFPLCASVFIPMLVSASSIKNRFSFPYSTLKILVAQNFSVFFFSAISIIISIVIPFCVSFFGDVDISQAVCGYFGIVLFFSAAISFCIFVFSAIKKGVVAFFVSVLILLLVNKIHNVPLYLDSTGLQGTVKFFSFAWHFDSFAKGIISLKEVFYFVLISVLFLYLSWVVIEIGKGNNSRYFKKLNFHFAITFSLLCIFSFFVPRKFDLTKNKKFSVSDYSKEILSNVTEPLKVTYYLSPKLEDLYPQVDDIKGFLENFSSYSDLVSFKIINPKKNEIKKSLEEIGIYGQPVRSYSVSTASVSNVYSAVVIEYLGMIEKIPFTISASSLEFDCIHKIKNLIEEKQKLVQIVIANKFSLERDYSYLVPYLKSLGFMPFETVLPSMENEEKKSFDNFNNIPLILIGSENFTREDCKKFEKFVLDGGKVFAALQPFSVDIENDWSIKKSSDQDYLARTFFTFGIYFRNTLTCDISNFRLTMQSKNDASGNPAEERNEYINYPLWPVLRPQVFAPNGMTVFWPCALDLDNEVAEIENLDIVPLLETSSLSWQLEEEKNEYVTNPFLCPKSPQDGTERKSFVISAAVMKKNNPENLCMILFSDQYAFSNPMISYSSIENSMDMRSLEYLGNGILLLCNERELLNIKNKPVFNYSLYKISGDRFLSAVGKTLLFAFCFPILLYIVLGVYFKIYYKKRIVIK